MTDDDIFGLDDGGTRGGDDAVKRDGRDRPYVYPADYTGELNFDRTKPKGSPRMTYARTTTYVDCLDDKTALDTYKQRNVLAGLVRKPSLLIDAKTTLNIGPLDDPVVKGSLNRIAQEARDAIYEDEKADRGTFVHLMCQVADEVIIVGGTPTDAIDAAMSVTHHYFNAADYIEDVKAYLRATLPLMRPVLVEQFLVVDEIQVAGTVDRVNLWTAPPSGCGIYDGDHVVLDIKTGTIEYSVGKFAMQFAVYAHGERYDQASNTRTALPDDVSTDWGIVAHVPAGLGVCELYWIDIAAGWEAVATLAGPVRKWRTSSKKLLTPFPELTLRDKVLGALNRAEVTELWRANADDWNDDLNELAKGKAA